MRPFLKIRLSDNAEAHNAALIIAQWRRARQLATFLPRAIRVYDALLRGDTSVLNEYFPFLTGALSNNRVNGNMPPVMTGRTPLTFAIPTVEYAQKSDDELIKDALAGLDL